MAQPVASQSSNITRQDLISHFEMMKSFRIDIGTNRTYRHFIPSTDPTELIKINNSSTNQYIYPVYQCECSRAMDKSRRNRIEYQVIDKIEKVFGKTKLLNIYSLGSGSCYQELSFGVKLAEEGYSVRQIVIVDKEYQSGDQELAVVEFSKFSKLLFPNVQISVYKEETEYLEEIKSSKQQKPDVILCIDVEQANISPRQTTYSKMLETNNNQVVFAYHNHLNLFDKSPDVCSVVEIVQGQAT